MVRRRKIEILLTLTRFAFDEVGIMIERKSATMLARRERLPRTMNQIQSAGQVGIRAFLYKSRRYLWLFGIASTRWLMAVFWQHSNQAGYYPATELLVQSFVADASWEYRGSNVTNASPQFPPLPDWLMEEGGDEDWNSEECIPFAAWQLPQNQVKPSTCNMFHEIDVSEPGALEFIACGGARCAFSIPISDHYRADKIVLKWIKTSVKAFSERSYSGSMSDTSAMERLQYSPYVLKIYGNCGSSQMLEAASHGTLYDQMVMAKHVAPKDSEGLMGDPETNLRISYHLARALADVHALSRRLTDFSLDTQTDFVAFTHNDIDCEQYIFVDGVFKLNDFHYASHEYQNRSSSGGCHTKGVSWSTKHTKLRAPEEFIDGKRKHNIRRNQVDVWMLGDVLYYTLTKQWVMEGYSNRETTEWYQQGRHAEIPEKIRQSSHLAHRAMIQALEMAWTFNPDKRPPAESIATVLEEGLLAINGGRSEAPWRVHVRKLPADYDFGSDPVNRSSSFIGFRDNYKDDPR